MTYKLMIHQHEGSDIIIKRLYQILADLQGLGKSGTAIHATTEATEDIGFTLIICPAFLRLNWRQEYMNFTGKGDDKVKIIDSIKEFKKFKPNQDHVAIISYAMIYKFPALFRYAVAVIADEAHYLCNMEARRTLVFHHFIEKYRPYMLVLLTGTPIKNRVKEFYSLLRLTDYGRYSDNKLKRYRTDKDFAETFSIPTTYQFRRNNRIITSTTYKGYRRLDELKAIMDTRVIRRTELADGKLPPLQFREILCFRGKDSGLKLEYETYKKQASKSITTAKVDSAIRKSHITAKYVKDLLEKTESVVVFSDHKEPLNIIAKALKGKRVAIITGAVPMKKRHQIIKDFQEGLIDVLLGTIGAMSTGLTLTICNNLVFNDQNWSPGSNEQAFKRIHRIGQGLTCFIHIMIGDFLDKKMSTQLKEKMETINIVIDN